MIPGDDLQNGVACERYPDGVADPFVKKDADTDRRLDRAGENRARLGYPDMEGVIGAFGEFFVCGDGFLYVGRLEGHLDLRPADIFKERDVIQGAFDHRIGVRPWVVLQDALLNGPGVHPEADRRFRIPRHDGNFFDLPQVIYRTGIYPDAVDAEFHRLERDLMIEMNVADDGNVHFLFKERDDLARLFLGKSYPHEFTSRLLQFPGLCQRLVEIFRVCLQHRLNDDRGPAPYGHPADLDRPCFFSFHSHCPRLK